MFYVTIKKDRNDFIKLQFWYNTDLRYEKSYSLNEFGSFNMLEEIKKWIEV